MIKTITTLGELSEIQEGWNLVYQDSYEPTPFQTFDYTYYAWQNFAKPKDKLAIITITRQKDKLLQAIFPFYIDKRQDLRFVNDRHTDFCNAIVRKEFVHDYHIYEELADYIKSQKEIRGLRFDNQSAGSPLVAFFCYFFISPVVMRQTAYSTVNIPEAEGSLQHIIDMLPNLSTKERYRLKNVQKKIYGDDFVVYSKADAPTYPEQHVHSLIARMIKEGIRTANYFDKNMQDLFKRLYDAGSLQVHLSLKDNTPIAANLYLKEATGDEYIDWIALYVEKKYNLENILLTIQHIAQTGGVLNFARGTYPYKIHNFRPCITNLYQLRYSKSVMGAVGIVMAVAWMNTKSLIKKIIRK